VKRRRPPLRERDQVGLRAARMSIATILRATRKKRLFTHVKDKGSQKFDSLSFQYARRVPHVWDTQKFTNSF
jgi:hypothetical protein